MKVQKVLITALIGLVGLGLADTSLPAAVVLGMRFVKIPAGSFLMGSGISSIELASHYGGDAEWYENEYPQHLVTINKPFFMQTTEVTQGQWKRVMGNNPSSFRNNGDDYPVENVTWYDVQKFIEKLNSIEGTNKYRLPTEAEWEYACRAGTTTRFSWGNDPDCTKANYANSSYCRECKRINPGQTMKVGSFGANAWGLYDMHGNVWEWCHDRYGKYRPESVSDPKGSQSGSYRVMRGGSWYHCARTSRSANRQAFFPGKPGKAGPGGPTGQDGFRLASD